MLFAFAVWCFWAFRYPYALSFHEQWQMFIADSEFFCERASMPGGIARYVSEYLVQFYYKPVFGALVIAIVYSLIQLVIWKAVKTRCKSELVAYVLSFIPSVFVWMCMGDEKVRFVFPVALLITGIAMMLCPSKEKRTMKLCYILIVTPLLAWITGPTVLAFALYVALRDIRKPIEYYGIAALLYAPLCVYFSGLFAPVPTYRLFYGVGYYLIVDRMPGMLYAVMLTFAAVPLLIPVIPKIKKNKVELGMSVTILILISLFCCISFPHSYLEGDYEVMKYDAMVRSQQWDKIISTAEKKQPDTPLTVTSLNLALAMKGQLNERSSEFFQNGTEGAFPQFNKQFQASMMTAEAYYYVGLVNTAQRFYFEGMESLPDSYSSRVFRRLAETNLINGQYDVSRKYLQILQKTMYYKDWATQTMQLLGDEKAIDSHPVYGHLRKMHLTEDFLFSEDEIDKIMGQLVIANNKNVVAIQYLLLLPQLQGDRQKYMMYRQFIQNELKGVNNDSTNNISE